MTTPTAGTTKTVVRTDAAPAPAHTFSQGLRKGGLLQVSGQGAVDPASGEYIGAGVVGAQPRRTRGKGRAVLGGGGATVEDGGVFRSYRAESGDVAG